MKRNNSTHKVTNKTHKRTSELAQDMITPREIHDIEADLKKMFENIFR